MRTTLRIDDDLLRELKIRAANEGLSLSDLVNLMLRQSVAEPPRPRRPFKQKTRAIALAHGASVLTLDSDFARFPDVRWESPLAK